MRTEGTLTQRNVSRLSSLVDNREEFRDGDADNAFKVWPSAVDRLAFRHAMSNELSGSEYATSRIVQAHDYFKSQAGQWLDKFAEGTGERDKAASALEDAVRKNLELVVIDLGDFDDPHVIFETLNARGTPLLQSDMVKNKILHDAKIGASDEDTERSPDERRLWAFDEDDWWAQEVGRDYKGDRASMCFSTIGLRSATGRRPSPTTNSGSSRDTRARGRTKDAL